MRADFSFSVNRNFFIYAEILVNMKLTLLTFLKCVRVLVVKDLSDHVIPKNFDIKLSM